jgi:organic hydroperoxide reductase OsmC/OhrA
VLALVEQAHHECYIANSLNSTIRITPTVRTVPEREDGS